MQCTFFARDDVSALTVWMCLTGWPGEVAGDWAAAVLLSTLLFPFTFALVPVAARTLGVPLRLLFLRARGGK
jgi:hypothetical protein